MSDFDKEAEREKLRKKYEEDQESREVAEKMSELLLQGATMTNAHCSDCGDPIFRYEGQEFCATCEKAVERDDEETAGAEEGDGDADDGQEDIEVASPDDARVQFGGNGQAEEAAEGANEDTAQAEQPSQAPQPSQQSPPQEQATRGQSTPSQPPAQPQPPRREVPGVEPDAASVETARDALVRTLTRFSQQAEATEDPQRAQEYLAAAREAAETIAALRR